MENYFVILFKLSNIEEFDDEMVENVLIIYKYLLFKYNYLSIYILNYIIQFNTFNIHDFYVYYSKRVNHLVKCLLNSFNN